MRLGLNLGYWRAPGAPSTPAEAVELARAAERLGYAVVWAAEAYGSDAATVLTWVAAHTSTIDVGSAVFQIPARSAAMTAMTAATLDTLSGGRFRLGLGVSGPQVSEGWHGVRFDAPLARTREYVDVVRLALRRERVEYAGQHLVLPLPDGPGRALKLALAPAPRNAGRAVPVYLAAVGPKNIELAAEIADGWLAIFFSPEHAPESLAGITFPAGFDVVPTVPTVVSLDGDDSSDGIARCADAVRGNAALYVGGMGSRRQNFYAGLMGRMGYARAAGEIQDAYLSGRQDEAAAGVPLEFLDGTSLLGSRERIAARLPAYAAAGVTTLNVAPFAVSQPQRIATLRTVAEALERSGLA